ncbi:5-formyltetrahydrofolate cyclo-ligase [Cohnella caldifontis]|uniref:5-formyltetrahydrofolate cyclo-ligase n=1 Tax=Cohnella caldifontis TaxID=3027471 RepID=UPI0023EB3725|nr:5-formyltetrahydrofolate cyclo-ligase [Cohnella sp. YIM B05605]
MSGEREVLAKAELRRRAASLRDAIPAAERAVLSERLCRTVEREVLAPLRERLGRPLTVGVYAAFRSEADPLPLARLCWAAGDGTAAPRVVGDVLAWRVVRGPDDWRPGRWGVPEPDLTRTDPLPPERPLDAVLVPGLAFHADGSRLGYGGGYYDRLFAAETARGNGETLWIGFAFSRQLTADPLPQEPHDLELDALATDDGVLWLDKGGKDGTDGPTDPF